MTAWIDIKERQPIEASEMLGTFMSRSVIAYGDSTVAEMDYTAGSAGGFWAAFSSYGPINPELVTHWMPMPTPPEPTP